MANQYEQFVKNSLSKYKNPDIAKQDVMAVFNAFSDLRPKLDDYVFNDGTKRTLLQLDGTIPVTYRGNIYNIPIAIWLMDTHPYNPPLVYVKPTSSMQIKPGPNVDSNGKIELPYLREWKYPNSDLLGLIQILTIIFGEEPPVYSKVSPSVRPPYPNQGVGQTPYPPAQGPFSMPMPGQTTPSYPSYPNQSGPGSTYPQYPSYPQQNYTGFSGYPPSTYPSSNPPYPTPYPSSTPASMNYPQQPLTAAATRPSFSGNQTVTEEHLKLSLLSAVEDKIKRRLRETFAQAQAEMDVLYKTHSDLMQGKDKLDKMIRDLEKEKVEVEGNTQLLRQKDEEVKEALKRLENQDELSIDEAVVTTTPLYRQLVNAFAEEQALDDAIYYLGEALRKNVIDLDVFLKQVRELSRRQFMLRALIQKCREKAGLHPLA
ncbi:hypothetical protein CHS0354_013003 [Potamilus streckersoni]|uniref:Tumor susceptibility gene 101 protein n=1 Tax=Potamilus streckersoni TaxID=2493646 RepID=A0AAE0W9A7_9BIVA|nr:hypothetical protein CHS0354_013003 [Potamilus streckersoni]